MLDCRRWHSAFNNPNDRLAYTETGAQEAVARLRARFPGTEIRVARTVVPNELGQYDTVFVIYPAFPPDSDVPF